MFLTHFRCLTDDQCIAYQHNTTRQMNCVIIHSSSEPNEELSFLSSNDGKIYKTGMYACIFSTSEFLRRAIAIKSSKTVKLNFEHTPREGPPRFGLHCLSLVGRSSSLQRVSSWLLHLQRVLLPTKTVLFPRGPHQSESCDPLNHLGDIG